jgi:hypothetical protein
VKASKLASRNLFILRRIGSGFSNLKPVHQLTYIAAILRNTLKSRLYILAKDKLSREARHHVMKAYVSCLYALT